MKIKVILLLISLLIMSCGSRLKETHREEIKTENDISLINRSEASVKLDKKTSEFQVSDLSKTKISVVPNKCPDSQIIQSRVMIVKDSKGNEVNIPVSENSEINFENTSHLETKLKETEIKLDEFKKENSSLRTQKTELQKKLDSSVKSSKPMWWLYVLIFVSGIVFIPTIKFFRT